MRRVLCCKRRASSASAHQMVSCSVRHPVRPQVPLANINNVRRFATTGNHAFLAISLPILGPCLITEFEPYPAFAIVDNSRKMAPFQRRLQLVPFIYMCREQPHRSWVMAGKPLQFDSRKATGQSKKRCKDGLFSPEPNDPSSAKPNLFHKAKIASKTVVLPLPLRPETRSASGIRPNHLSSKRCSKATIPRMPHIRISAICTVSVLLRDFACWPTLAYRTLSTAALPPLSHKEPPPGHSARLPLPTGQHMIPTPAFLQAPQ